MLYGQNLPWRAAARQVSRRASSIQRTPTSALHTARRCQLTSSTPNPLPSIWTQRTPVATLDASRHFSSFPARWKEDRSKAEPETQQAAEESKDKLEENMDNEASERTAEEASSKRKIPDPLPSNKTGDGRGATAGGAGGGSGSGNEGGGRKRKSSERALQKPTVPQVYPQVMAIPIGKRPLFPGFYKAITIRNPHVAKAIQEMVQRGQPYIGAFLLKDDDADKDIIESTDDVYDVGTFCQITSAFPVQGEEPSMTAVLYPHRRIKMSSLIPPHHDGEVSKAEVTEAKTEEPEPEKAAEDKKGDVVASFEETAAEQAKQPPHYEPTSFLKKYPVSLVNVDNLVEEPHEKDSCVMRPIFHSTKNT